MYFNYLQKLSHKTIRLLTKIIIRFKVSFQIISIFDSFFIFTITYTLPYSVELGITKLIQKSKWIECVFDFAVRKKLILNELIL
jgi:hypothetical protein